MKKETPLILALIIEVSLLFVIFILLLIGVLGIFLPIIPGLLFIGAGVGLYSLLIRNGHGKFTPTISRFLLKVKYKIFSLKITKNSMGLIKAIKKRKKEKVKEEILKNGLVLCGFNLALILAFFFGFIGLSILANLMKLDGVVIAFVPLIVIFLFAGASGVIWYRFGQILGGHFKKRKILNSSLVVLISILPLLAILLLFSGIISLAGGFANQLLVVTFLGFLLMSVLAAVFELLIISLGIITTVK